jgi:hypothetical protein
LVESLGIEFLPLIDIEEEPVRTLLVGSREKAADAAAEGAIRPTQNLDLLLDPVIGREGRQVGWGGAKRRTRAWSGSGPGRRLRMDHVRPSARRRRAGSKPA